MWPAPNLQGNLTQSIHSRNSTQDARNAVNRPTEDLWPQDFDFSPSPYQPALPSLQPSHYTQPSESAQYTQPSYTQPTQYSQARFPTHPPQTIQYSNSKQRSNDQQLASGNRNVVANRTGTALKRVRAELPERFASLFKFAEFNAVQSLCLDLMLRSGKNVVVSAPTGAGKTVVLELAMIREMMNSNTWNDNCKVVYMAPTKALVNERYLDWKNKFQGMGIQVTELTSDTAWMEVKSVRDATIIITVSFLPDCVEWLTRGRRRKSGTP